MSSTMDLKQRRFFVVFSDFAASLLAGCVVDIGPWPVGCSRSVVLLLVIGAQTTKDSAQSYLSDDVAER